MTWWLFVRLGVVFGWFVVFGLGGFLYMVFKWYYRVVLIVFVWILVVLVLGWGGVCLVLGLRCFCVCYCVECLVVFWVVCCMVVCFVVVFDWLGFGWWVF